MAQSSEYRLPTAADWKQQIIEDIELQAIEAGAVVPPTAKGSDFDLKAGSLGNSLAVLTANLVIQDNDSNVDTAEGAALDEKREALGLPEAPSTAASGYVTVSSTASAGITVVNGLQWLAAGAVTGKVTGTHYSVVTDSELFVTCSKTGSAGMLKAGAKIRFISPPPGLATEATVARDFTGGADEETDEKKRRRIKNRLQNPVKGANWSHVRDLALSATNAIDNAFVYPAVGGPSSQVVACLAPWYNGGSGQSRVVASTATDAVLVNIETEINTDSELVAVKSTADEMVDLRLLLDVLPGDSSWIDVTPWPSVAATVYAVTSNTQFRVQLSESGTAPSVGKTIAIWSVEELAFRTAVIQTVTVVSSLIYTLTTSAWQGGALTVTVGQQVSPGAGNMAAWATALLDIFGAQTPGEICLSIQDPRSLRKPSESVDEPVGFGSRELGDFIDQFDEISDATIDTISVSEPTRTLPALSPNVLCLRSLSIGAA